jgi:hypothetical protein
MARLAPDNERALDAIVEQMQAELGFGALATSGGTSGKMAYSRT